MSLVLDKIYNPQQIETQIYKQWEKSGYFNPDNLTGAKKGAFTIVLPPPNITGTLHMGHALNAVIQDILIRQKRMEGYKTLWVPGVDHAGIATQNVIEKQLKKEGLTRQQLGKEKFLARIWAWKEKYGHIIFDQLKKLGASCDWSRTTFTLDEKYSQAVKTAFYHYQKKGWLYQKERIVNWCSRCGTSLSDLEIEYKEEKGKLWFIKYPLLEASDDFTRTSKTLLAEKEQFITVATTRPETLLGDAAVAVHPKDERYKSLVGRIALLPILNRRIPIIADAAVDKEFGTGAVKVTPAHDFTDAEIGERHQLPIYKIIDEQGRLTKITGQDFEGLKILEGREKVLTKLKTLKLLAKEEDYSHRVAKCERCGYTVESLLSLQWFIKMDELAKKAIAAVKNGQVKFHPRKWEKTYLAWLKNVKDWCISRQIWWGHKISLAGSEDVLDTWFSSALWPLATLGWPRLTKDWKRFYPTQVISTARDIINLWVARMVFSGIEFTGQPPFKDVIIHATILNKEGKRMSKSLGTGVDPMDLIEKYGADAVRFGLIWQSMGSQDIHWAEEHVIAGRKFCNKIWNSARFVLMRLDNLKIPIQVKAKTAADKKMLAAFIKTKKDVEKHLNKYEFGHALHKLYNFYWHQYCDIYLEKAKKQNNNETKKFLAFMLVRSLKLLHPFMPFITEAIFQMFQSEKNRKMLMTASWND